MRLLCTYMSSSGTSIIPWVLYENVYIKRSKLQDSYIADNYIFNEWITTNKLIRIEKPL